MVHHMNDNSMFSSLVNYKNYSYYKNHKYIYFYTLRDGQTVENTYDVDNRLSIYFQINYSN